jgi:hypothetical protein
LPNLDTELLDIDNDGAYKDSFSAVWGRALLAALCEGKGIAGKIMDAVSTMQKPLDSQPSEEMDIE